jgi:hypothetical protein
VNGTVRHVDSGVSPGQSPPLASSTCQSSRQEREKKRAHDHLT